MFAADSFGFRLLAYTRCWLIPLVGDLCVPARFKMILTNMRDTTTTQKICRSGNGKSRDRIVARNSRKIYGTFSSLCVCARIVKMLTRKILCVRLSLDFYIEIEIGLSLHFRFQLPLRFASFFSFISLDFISLSMPCMDSAPLSSVFHFVCAAYSCLEMEEFSFSSGILINFAWLSGS